MPGNISGVAIPAYADPVNMFALIIVLALIVGIGFIIYYVLNIR